MSKVNECCKDVKEALIDLFINVKIRNVKSFSEITSEKLESEKQELVLLDNMDLIEAIKGSIEVLINMKMDEESELGNNKSMSSIKMHCVQNLLGN